MSILTAVSFLMFFLLGDGGNLVLISEAIKAVMIGTPEAWFGIKHARGSGGWPKLDLFLLWSWKIYSVQREVRVTAPMSTNGAQSSKDENRNTV